MNIINKIRTWWSALFYGMKGADDAIFSASVDNSHIVGVHQVKDIHRVAPSLLKGEVTQEVAELRYRDYKVSEHSRRYKIVGEDAIQGKGLTATIKNYPKFTAYNHEIYQSFNEVNDGGESYTLKVGYKEQPIFRLEKYCDRFLIDKDSITLVFSTIPNRNIPTSKAFINRLIKRSTTNLEKEDEYSQLRELSFISYKISVIPNYWSFKFKNPYLVGTASAYDEIYLTYRAISVDVEDLTAKYVIKDLEMKYQEKAPKYLPSDINVSPIEYRCEVCGKVITKNEGDLNKEVNGKFCCTDCLFKNFIENDNSDRIK